MALDVTTLNTWVRESGDKADIIIKAFMLDPSLDYVDKYKDVKGEIIKLPIVSSTGKADNTMCSANDTDNLTISQFTMQGKFKRYRNSLCLDQLDTYFTKQWHSGDTLSVLDELFGKEIALKLTHRAKRYLWMSNTGIAALDADFKEFDGLLKIIDSTAGVQYHTIAIGKVIGTINDASTEKATDVIDSLYDKLPTEAKTDQPVIAFCPPEVFEYVKTIIKSDNLYHYKIEDLQLNNYALAYPGKSNLILIKTDALGNSIITNQDNTQKDRIVMTPANNIAIGMDISTLQDSFNIFFDELNDKLIIKASYWIASGIKFGDFVASSKRS